MPKQPWSEATPRNDLTIVNRAAAFSCPNNALTAVTCRIV